MQCNPVSKCSPLNECGESSEMQRSRYSLDFPLRSRNLSHFIIVGSNIQVNSPNRVPFVPTDDCKANLHIPGSSSIVFTT